MANRLLSQMCGLRGASFKYLNVLTDLLTVRIYLKTVGPEHFCSNKVMWIIL